MAARQPTPILQACPPLSHVAFFSAQHPGLVADDLAPLRARHDAPAMPEATIRALRRFAVLIPAARQLTLDQDLAQTTPRDSDAWIEASFHHQLAPGPVAPRRRVVQGVCACRRDQGEGPPSPSRRPRPDLLGPQDLPRPLAAAEVSACVRGLEAWRARPRCLWRRRGGLRVGDVSRRPGAALALAQGPPGPTRAPKRRSSGAWPRSTRQGTTPCGW
jgi:hypothetical protein